MEINIDFDGTCVSHEFPKIGKDIGAVPVLKKLVEKGHRLILFTMRSDRKDKNPTGHSLIQDVTGMFLTEAVNWFKENNIPLYGVQTNPTQLNWTTSPKSYAQLMIDDSALGCPLKQDFKAIYTGDVIHSTPLEHLGNKQVKELVGRPYVDWEKVEKILINQNIL